MTARASCFLLAVCLAGGENQFVAGAAQPQASATRGDVGKLLKTIEDGDRTRRLEALVLKQAKGEQS